jgi:hypothetical protein
MFSASALYPLEVLKTRMQAETKVVKKKNDGERACWFCFIRLFCGGYDNGLGVLSLLARSQACSIVYYYFF